MRALPAWLGIGLGPGLVLRWKKPNLCEAHQARLLRIFSVSFHLYSHMRQAFFLLLLAGLSLSGWAQDSIVRGFSIKAPEAAEVPAFLDFIDQVLAPRQVNTLLLRVDYNFAYQSHPELRNESTLSQAQVDQLVAACRARGIRIVPQINLLGHQSWHSEAGNLLQVYPQFDETPAIDLPETYVWPNADGLYCKSYCPRHPEVHAVVFALVDEIVRAFQADAFHAGLDEVFYIGEDQCPRCRGRDKAVLFAEEVRRIHDHLAAQGVELWMWGDRLLDGSDTGLGMWEASMNNTHQAIDLIPRSVVICDWHYEQAEPTAAYFALKGFRVITCPWRKPEVAEQQWADFSRFRTHSNPVLAGRYLGMMQTIWTSADRFMALMADPSAGDSGSRGQVDCFEALAKAWSE